MDMRTRARIIHHQVQARPTKTYMQTYPVSPEAIYQVSQLPAKDPERSWKYAHLLSDGVEGWHARDLAETEPLALKDLIRMWGFATYMLKQADAFSSNRVLKG